MEIPPINEDNFTREELDILAMELSEISKKEFNCQSLQVRARLMSKQVMKNLNEGWTKKE